VAKFKDVWQNRRTAFWSGSHLSANSKRFFFYRQFVFENFEDDEKLDVCVPEDWIENPEVFNDST